MTQSIEGMVESAVRDRYSDAAQAQETALCCPVDYDPKYLEVIPQEVLDRDYGCGDPSAHIRSGETVLDLGAGGGKIAFIASQVVGPEGRVIGVDMNSEMLSLARGAAPQVEKAMGYANVEFRRGRIQDLSLDLDRVDAWLRDNPVACAEDLSALEAHCEALRGEPLIGDNSIDVVVSNCVLNLVRPSEKAKLFREIVRVLKPGGRAVISDIVADEPVPEHLQADPELWSGCISGALTEEEFLSAFEEAGFHGIQILELSKEPWKTVEGIEFRSMTVEAFVGKAGPCWERNQALVYLGPWKRVEDDDGHLLERGVRTAVCDKTYRLLSSQPYAGQLAGIEPATPIALEDAQPFPCSDSRKRRSPTETKGGSFAGGSTKGDCGPEGCC